MLGGSVTKAQTGVPSDEYFRLLLNYEESGAEVIQLISYGEKAFPAYHRIIGAANASPILVERVFYILQSVKADQSGFVEPAMKWLGDSESGVRRQALKLLGQIGSRKETPPIVALMWDADRTIVRAAAETLAAICNDRDLMAVELWIKSDIHADGAVLRQHGPHARKTAF